MLRMLGTRRRCCDGVTRRETLKVGALSALGGLTLPRFLSAKEQGHVGDARAKNVIVLYLLGGAATQDMVDLKPDAPAGIRSEFLPIATSAPGIEVCEHLPGMARWMHKMAVVRSMHHQGGCHNTLPSYSGYEEPLTELLSIKDSYPPGMGSVMSYVNRDRHDAPNYMYLPNYLGWGLGVRKPGPYGGFLGGRYDPLFAECAPYSDDGKPDKVYYPKVVRGKPVLPNGVLGDITLDRFDRRRSLLNQLDGETRRIETQNNVGQFDRFHQQAVSLLRSSGIRQAFDIDSMEKSQRDRYGNTLFGNSVLVGRRLLEAGVRFVNVTWDGYVARFGLNTEVWDTHQRNFPLLENSLLPYFDLAFTALMEDLDSSGLLDETLVLVMSEMGRTPKVNADGGRDHWTYCYSVMLAGAGIRGGTLYGASDAQAAFIKDMPVNSGDICATVYRCLGIDPDMTVPDRNNRPVPISHGGKPIDEILA